MALADVRVVPTVAWHYGTKLLADLGAGYCGPRRKRDLLRQRGPFLSNDRSISLWHSFLPPAGPLLALIKTT